MTATLYYLHGRDSSPQGFRAEYLRNHFPDIIAPELKPDVIERRAVIDPLIKPEAVLIGSSMGGMTALDFVGRFPEKVKAMVLLAPAVGFTDPAFQTPEILAFVNNLVVPPGVPATVIAALGDEVIPLASIKALVSRSKGAEIVYHEVDDTHSLRGRACLDLMTEAARGYML
ncbi:MAG: alpha/beta fold hydrolase [Acidobacteriota bacterium]|nr:alpha/beta fold hydrolase [Acidobacteriota bacterium]